MKNIRIIPRLDIKGPNLVKGIHLEGLRVLGKPESFAKYYYQAGADELIYMDVVASLYGRNSLLPIIEKTAKEVFIPLTVGGGLRTINDINAVLRAGADKVSINTAAVKNPEFIRKAARKFGSSTIVVSIEAIKQPDGRYLAFTDNGREHTGLDVFEWAKRVFELGAGEILLTSVDKEGTGLGYDIELTQRVAESVTIPVIACGGGGRLEHIRQIIVDGKADAVAISSMIHYDVIANHSLEGDFSEEGNTEYLKSEQTFSRVTPVYLQDIKEFLTNNGVACRFPVGCEVFNG
ncbi:MAG: imidazole glycerol phosphate synthase cyclase subunit [Candidatus Omnitrophica bacterium]|nr:imidazole glycerol phosphate synthase cyclase subunit [Candidatus Omnitrophota bacterium]MDD5352417.1 imidazole glycerol phosphate synthase cyclase subunit [Candidatus Omnitrophota bacterium]MDD5550015.1 imidazole glycerol phosphate synthase cyclase subunit [Candidatus Omnitrophota bacterium]